MHFSKAPGGNLTLRAAGRTNVRGGSIKAILAAAVGNMLEWYDFAVYGYFATIIAKNFFSAGSEVSSLLSAFAAFGIGFVVRPLGGLVIGRMADVHGRKAALLLALFLMAIGTAGIGLLPTFNRIGTWAPILLVALRLLQGFSAGGEWAGSAAFIVEWAPQNKRGYFGSFQQAAVAGGMLLGSGSAALLSTGLTVAQVESWGWRIPFLIGGILAPIGLYIRRYTGETPAFLCAQAAWQKASKKSLVLMAGRAFGFTILWTVSYYLMLSYMPVFIQRFAEVTRTQALCSNTIGLLVLMVSIPLTGGLSDRIGRKPLLLASCISFIIISYPLFRCLTAGAHFVDIIGIQVIFGLMIALFAGPGPAAIVEMFPTNSRSTWMSAGYTLSTAIFGGFAPFVATWLIAATGSPIAPVYYLVAAAMVSMVVIFLLRETVRDDLK